MGLGTSEPCQNVARRGGDRIVLSVNAMAEESQIPVFAALLAADANGNQRLDLDEAKGVPRAVFPTVDRNRDNQIDEGEWAEFRVQALQPSATLSIRPNGRGDLTKIRRRMARSARRAERAVTAGGGGLVYTVRNGGVAGIYDAATGEVKKEFRLPGALGDYYASPGRRRPTHLLREHGGQNHGPGGGRRTAGWSTRF